MDKKKKKEAPAKITEGDERKKTETRKKMKRNKEVEAEASSKNTKSEAQQTIRQDEVAVITSDQSEENDRMKIGLAAKRTKKPPKSLENFICRPTARIPQRLSHGDCQSSCGGDGSSSEITMQSHEKSQKKDSNDCVTTKASTMAMPTSRKAPSKQTKKTDSKSLLTSDGPLYAVQPQTESKAPPSDRKSSSTPQKQTYSPPAAPSPLSSLQQNSGPHNGTQVFNVQIGTGGDLSTGTTITGSLPSQSLKDTRRKVHTTQKSSSGFQSDSEHSSCYSENSSSLKPTAKSKTLKSKVSDVDKCMNSANVKEDSKQGGDSTGSKNNFKANRRSKENDSAHPTNSSIKIPPSVLSTSKTSTDSSVDAIRTSETLESKRKNKKRIEGHDIDENRKRTLELTQTIPVAVQSKHSSSMVHIIDKKRARHSSNHEGNMQCYFQTSSSADCHYNTSIHSTVKSSGDETCSRHKQTDNLEKKQKVAKMMTVINQVDKIDRVENACKTIPQTANLSKISAFKSSKTFESSMCEIRPVVGHPIAKPFQSPSLISDLEPQLRKRGRPKMIRLEESSHGSKSHKSLTKPPILEHTNIPDSEVDLKRLQPVQRKRGRPRLSFSVQKQRSEPVASGSLQNSTEDNLKTSSSKTKDAQICRKRNRLIMKTIVRNINKMKMKKRDEVLTQFLSGQKQSSKANSAHKSNEVEVESSVSDPTKSLSSLVTSFGGRLGPQINVSKRGTIYIGKRRGRKPKAQREISGEDSNQIQFQKSQKVDESTNQVNSWFTPGSHSISFDNQPNLSSSPQLFKYPNSFRKKLYTNNCDYDQHCAPKASSSQKKNAVAEVKSRPRSALRSTPLPTAMTQLGSVRMQECRAAHIARSVLMEQEKLKYKCHRKDHNYLNRDKIRRHKHKCKRKYLQLRTKRKDPEFLSEIEELVVRLSGIHIVHHVSQGDEAKSGRKSSNRKGHPHVLQCLPQNLHHPTMFQINFSGYYSPQSDFPHDSLHYVHMADFKRNNGCSSQPSEQIVTHCPVVHKLGFPLTGSGCYHSPCRLPLSATSFGFGLYRGYPPSATIYPSSPFLPSYVHPYSKHPILSPSKFHKRKHKSLRQDPLCGGKPQGTYPNVTSQSPNDWFSRSSWPWVDNRDKRLADERLRGGKDFKVGQSKDHASRSGPSSNFPFSSSVATKKTEKHKSSLPSYIGPAHLRPASKVRLAEHQRPWRWRGSNSNVDQAAASGYQEDETVTGPERDEDLQSTSQSERKIHHNNFLQDPNIPSSAKSQMTVQRSAANVQGATRKLVRPGSSWMKKKYSGKRASESFQTGGPVFRDNRHQLTVEQDRDGRDPRHNISRALIQTNDMSPFSSSTATKTSLSHSSCTLLNKSKLKHIYKPFTNKSFQCQMGNRNVATRRGRGRPRKNPAAGFSPSLPTPPFHDGVAEKKRKGETETASEFASQCEESRMRKKRDFQKVRHEDDDEQGTFVSQEPSSSHSDSSSPSRDTSVSAHSQSGRSSLMPPDKKYEWAGLYSDVYKTKDTMSPSSLENAECLDYDPEEHQHGLLPAPIHVGKYLRLKRIHFQLPYDIYWLCAHNKLPNITDFPQKTATPNGSDGVMSLTQPEDRFYNYNVPHDCISDSPNRDDSLRGPAEEDGKEANQTDTNNEFTNQCEPLKQQKRGSDAENVPSALLIMPLSCEERSFILEHCIFLVRNYEKMRVRQAVLLREGGREQEKENKESRGSSQCQTGVFQDNISTKSDGRLNHSSLQSEGKKNRVQSRNLTQTLQGIYDVIVSSKGSSGQTLAAPLLNLCSRKRSGSAPVDLSMLQQQLLTGHYETLDAFHSDMLRVFYCAEKYYGCESSVGRNVKQLREVYNNAYKEAQTPITNFP